MRFIGASFNDKLVQPSYADLNKVFPVTLLKLEEDRDGIKPEMGRLHYFE